MPQSKTNTDPMPALLCLDGTPYPVPSTGTPWDEVPNLSYVVWHPAACAAVFQRIEGPCLRVWIDYEGPWLLTYADLSTGEPFILDLGPRLLCESSV